MRPINPPTSFTLTNNWHDIQFTNLHQYHAHVSQEYNKLLKAHGRGSFFIIKGFKLGLFKATINGKETLVARLTPGIYVHDWTIIDYVQPMRKSRLFIYIKVFDEDDHPAPRQVYKIGSFYYHGIYGDGINACPTYSIIKSIKGSDDHTNFRTFYRLTLGDDYGQNGKIDIPNINVDDFTTPPNDKDPTDPEDPWNPIPNPDDPTNPQDPEDDPDAMDYVTIIARSTSLLWAMVVDGHK